MIELAAEIGEFMEAEKRLGRRFRWVSYRRDYARASAPVLLAGRPRINARVEMTHHMHRIPKKFGFALIYQGMRIAGLDVSPGRPHTNLITLETILGTHWQFWPNMDAIADASIHDHRIFLDKFLRRCKIISRHKYAEPPFEREQPRLEFDV